MYVTALFLDILDTTIVNVAFPALGREFQSDSVEWVVLGYTLSLAVWIPAAGWFGDRFGTKRTFLFAFTAFTLGSLLCASAQSIGQLIAFRVFQGVGGGMLTPVGIAMLFRVFPPAQRAKVATIIMIPTLVAPALGPLLGGVIVTHFSWRWIFLVNVPVGIVGLIVGLRYLREHREPRAGGFDVPGFVLSGSGLALIVFSLSEGPRLGWGSTQVLAAAAMGLCCATAMVIVELRVEHPMLHLRLLKNRMFRQCNIVSIFSQASFLGVVFIMPLYLQNFRGLSPQRSGLTTFTQPFGVLISSQIAGRLYKRIGPRRLMTGGLLAAGMVISSLAFITATTSLWVISSVIFVRGLCMGFSFVPMQAASYATIAPSDNGRAASIFSTQRQVATSVSIAVLVSVLSSYMTLSGPPDDAGRALTGYRLAFSIAVAFALLAAFAASFIRDADAAPTMAR